MQKKITIGYIHLAHRVLFVTLWVSHSSIMYNDSYIFLHIELLADRFNKHVKDNASNTVFFQVISFL